MNVYKYPLEVAERQVIELPSGCKVLSVQEQYGCANLWALVDPDAPKHPMTIRIFGTGWPVDNAEALEFIDTFQMDGGALVFHVFAEVRAALRAEAGGEESR